MKPTYPELLKAFKLALKYLPTDEEERYIIDTIDKLKSSEDMD